MTAKNARDGSDDLYFDEIIKGWELKKTLSTAELSSMTPFVNLYVILKSGDQSADTNIITQMQENDSLNLISSRLDFYTYNTAAELTEPYRNEDLFLCPVGSISTQPKTYRSKGDIGITQLKVSRESANYNSAQYNLTFDISDTGIFDQKQYLTKLLSLGNEFVIIYGWISKQDLSSEEYFYQNPPSPPTDANEKMVVNIGKNNMGFWMAQKITLWKLDYNLDNSGHTIANISFVHANYQKTIFEKIGGISSNVINKLTRMEGSETIDYRSILMGFQINYRKFSEQDVAALYRGSLFENLQYIDLIQLPENQLLSLIPNVEAMQEIPELRFYITPDFLNSIISGTQEITVDFENLGVGYENVDTNDNLPQITYGQNIISESWDNAFWRRNNGALYRDLMDIGYIYINSVADENGVETFRLPNESVIYNTFYSEEQGSIDRSIEIPIEQYTQNDLGIINSPKGYNYIFNIWDEVEGQYNMAVEHQKINYNLTARGRWYPSTWAFFPAPPDSRQLRGTRSGTTAAGLRVQSSGGRPYRIDVYDETNNFLKTINTQNEAREGKFLLYGKVDVKYLIEETNLYFKVTGPAVNVRLRQNNPDDLIRNDNPDSGLTYQNYIPYSKLKDMSEQFKLNHPYLKKYEAYILDKDGNLVFNDNVNKIPWKFGVWYVDDSVEDANNTIDRVRVFFAGVREFGDYQYPVGVQNPDASAGQNFQRDNNYYPNNQIVELHNNATVRVLNPYNRFYTHVLANSDIIKNDPKINPENIRDSSKNANWDPSNIMDIVIKWWQEILDDDSEEVERGVREVYAIKTGEGGFGTLGENADLNQKFYIHQFNKLGNQFEVGSLVDNSRASVWKDKMKKEIKTINDLYNNSDYLYHIPAQFVADNLDFKHGLYAVYVPTLLADKYQYPGDAPPVNFDWRTPAGNSARERNQNNNEITAAEHRIQSFFLKEAPVEIEQKRISSKNFLLNEDGGYIIPQYDNDRRAFVIKIFLHSFIRSTDNDGVMTIHETSEGTKSLNSNIWELSERETLILSEISERPDFLGYDFNGFLYFKWEGMYPLAEWSQLKAKWEWNLYPQNSQKVLQHLINNEKIENPDDFLNSRKFTNFQTYNSWHASGNVSFGDVFQYEEEIKPIRNLGGNTNIAIQGVTDSYIFLRMFTYGE